MLDTAFVTLLVVNGARWPLGPDRCCPWFGEQADSGAAVPRGQGEAGLDFLLVDVASGSAGEPSLWA